MAEVKKELPLKTCCILQWCDENFSSRIDYMYLKVFNRFDFQKYLVKCRLWKLTLHIIISQVIDQLFMAHKKLLKIDKVNCNSF